MSRKIIPFVVAFVLICLVMAVSGLFAFSGVVTAEKFGSDMVWSQPYSTAESMNVINVMADDQDELFIQNTTNVSVYDGSGATLFSQDYQYPKTTLADINADGMEDIVVFYLGDLGYSVDTIVNGEKSTLTESLNIGLPARVAIIRFPPGAQIVLGDSSGNLLSLSLDGQPLWSYSVGSEEIRGMDDARIGGAIHLAAASHSGALAVLDSEGKAIWTTSQEQLRRMRAFDLNGDGNSEVITGGEYGALYIYSAADGNTIFNSSLGQAVSEVREVELNGDPSSREIVVGGKDGGVWAFSNTGNQLWSGSLSDKVTEISGIDINGDGKEEAVIGAESGEVAIYSENGSRNNLTTHSTPITRIDVGKLGNERYVIIADGNEVQVHKASFSSIPGFQYTPMIVGVIVSAVILVIAAILTSIPKKPELKVSFQDKSKESLEAERRMLKESIADVERLRKSGEVTGDAYLARLKRLRRDLADNEAAFKAAGFPIKVETIQCPNCGGTLELGMDKCEYCGQVLLS
ncbi:MAG TPA: PQQ-binding-like beta-propeller repeat protein [Anaerolineales bacterium]|nr:PQQ-binding-like beta-propeller repeat protein [Anaerolineales bacterium]